MLKEQYEVITGWQMEKFPNATPLSCANHLEEEVKELIAELEKGNLDRMEIADCFLLLIGVCNMADFTYNDIVELIDDKMKINYKRKWGQVNEKGYVKHI